MPHLVLLGDSIFDNAVYVPGNPPVIEQVRQALPADWRGTLLAVDGDVTADVRRQLQKLPAEATYLAVSVGGNDALSASAIMSEPVRTVNEAMARLAEIHADFRREYQGMLAAVLARRLPTLVCTIYDAIPGLPRDAVAALSLFNDVILREAAAAKIPVLDLRLVCTEPGDYSEISPIEPSVLGGAKIAVALARIMTTHDFSRPSCLIYGGD